MKVKQLLTYFSAKLATHRQVQDNPAQDKDAEIQAAKRRVSATRSQLMVAEQRKVFLAQTEEQVLKEIDLWRTKALDEQNSEHQSLACVGLLSRFEQRKKQLEQQRSELQRLSILLAEQLRAHENHLLSKQGLRQSTQHNSPELALYDPSGEKSSGDSAQSQAVMTGVKNEPAYFDARFCVKEYSEELPLLKARLHELRKHSKS